MQVWNWVFTSSTSPLHVAFCLRFGSPSKLWIALDGQLDFGKHRNVKLEIAILYQYYVNNLRGQIYGEDEERRHNYT